MRFGGLLALSNLSFTIGNGGVVGLIGPNGAGKSTTLMTICGIVQVEKGEITLEDEAQSLLTNPKIREAYLGE